ncbi:hypothetical protein [Actinacidiphila rubida]|nr:hypothetical protein [Actinacidiphila rubida]
MISEPEMGDGPENRWGAGAFADTVGTAPANRGGWPWRWVVGAVIATSAAGALVLHLTGYGQASRPDLHHYTLSESPCSGDNLKPLTDSFATEHFAAAPAAIRTGPALDLAQCTLDAQGSVGAKWAVLYNAVVTVQLHKKTDPAPEFDDLGGPHPLGQNAPWMAVVDPSGIVTSSRAQASVPVPGLGDSAYLLTDDDGDETLTVRHGGAVLTIALSVAEQWSGPGGAPPPDADGYPQKPPRLNAFRPALVATMRTLMTALSR